MSGHKRTTITLSRNELRRLQEASQRLSQVDQDFQKIEAQIAHLREQNFTQSQKELESRQQAFNHSLEGVTAHLAAIEYSTSQAVVSQAASLQEEITRMGADVWENTHALLEAHAQQLEEVFVESQAARQTQFQRLHHSVSQIRRSEQEKNAFAGQAIEESRVLYESVAALYGQEESAQSGLQSAGHLIDQAIENINAGFSEAALLATQQSFDLLAHTRLRVENLIQQRQVLHQIGQDRLMAVKGILQANSSVRAVNSQGEPLDSIIDVDFWSRGGWKGLVKRFHRLESQLNSGSLGDPANLQQIIDELASLENEIPYVVFNARLAVISSQVRYNIAESVVAALQEQGYTLENSAYDGNDMRCTYSLQLGNFEGSRVMVQLTPHQQDPIAHNLDIAYADPDLRSEHEMRQRAGELSTSLHAHGLQLNALQELPEARTGSEMPSRRVMPRLQEKRQPYGIN